MVIKLTTQDFEDAYILETVIFDVSSMEQLDLAIKKYWDERIREDRFSITSEDGFTELVDAITQRPIDTNLFAFKSVSDAENEVNGLLLAARIYYDPGVSEYQVNMTADNDGLYDLPDEVVSYWGLNEFVRNTSEESLQSLSGKALVEQLLRIYYDA